MAKTVVQRGKDDLELDISVEGTPDRRALLVSDWGPLLVTLAKEAPELVDVLSQRLQQAGDAVVVTHNGELQAVMVVTRSRTALQHARVDVCYVVPNARGSGVGARLLREVIDEAVRGKHHIVIDVPACFVQTAVVLRHLGFVKTTPATAFVGDHWAWR